MIRLQAPQDDSVMAQNERDRRNLLSELTALDPRVELAIGDRSILVGFRANHAASIYFGQDFVVGFNPDHEVRRVFLHGSLFRAESGRRITRLDRHREQSQVELQSEILVESSQNELQSIIRWHVEMLARALAGDRYHILGCVPEDEGNNVLATIRAELHAILDNGIAFADGI